MSIKGTTRTIDNLGSDANVRYAQAQAALDPSLLSDSKYVSNVASVSVTQPYIPSEFDLLFSAAPTSPRALFSSPPGYEGNTRNLFSHQLAPSLGDYQTCADRLGSVKESSLEKGEVEPLTSLLNLLQQIGKLDKNIYYITGKRNEFHRG